MDRYQKVAGRLWRDRKIGGQTFKGWGATDSKKGMGVKAAKNLYKQVRLVKMPKTIRNADPEAAKYIVVVRGPYTREDVKKARRGGKRRRK